MIRIVIELPIDDPATIPKQTLDALRSIPISEEYVVRFEKPNTFSGFAYLEDA